jgi:hypothetical protein
MSAPTPVPPVTQEKDRRKRRFVMWGAVAAVGALITAAAFVDSEWANISPDRGFETGTFNLQTSLDGQDWDDWSGPTDALDVNLNGGLLIPGGAPQTGTYYVLNDSAGYDADLTVRMVQKAGATTDAALRDALRFDVSIGGTQLADDATYSELTGGTATSVRLDEGDDAPVTVAVSLDQAAADDADVQGAAAHLQLVIDGDSVPTT